MDKAVAHRDGGAKVKAESAANIVRQLVGGFADDLHRSRDSEEPHAVSA